MLVNPNLSGGGGGGEFTLPANVIYLITQKWWKCDFATLQQWVALDTLKPNVVSFTCPRPQILDKFQTGFFLCNFWMSSQIPSSHTLIVILTWNLDYYLKLSRETRRKQKIRNKNPTIRSCRQVMTSSSFPRFLPNLCQSRSRIPDRWYMFYKFP